MSCNRLYIGETKRYLKNRIAEHIRYVKNINKLMSPLAEHCVHNNHTIDWTKAKIIKSSHNSYERKVDEAFIIRGYDENSLLNRDLGYDIDNC